MPKRKPDREQRPQISQAPDPISHLRFSARVEPAPAFDEKMDAFDKPYWNEWMLFAWVRWRDRQKVNAQSPPDSLAYDGAVLYPGTAPIVNGREAESVNIALQLGALRAFKGTNEFPRLTWASREAKRGDDLIFLRDEVLNCWPDSPVKAPAPSTPAIAPVPKHIAPDPADTTPAEASAETAPASGPLHVTEKWAYQFTKEYIDHEKAEKCHPTQCGLEKAARATGRHGGRHYLRKVFHQLQSEAGINVKAGPPKKRN